MTCFRVSKQVIKLVGAAFDKPICSVHIASGEKVPDMILNGVGYSFHLLPTDGTQVFGRSLFRIHPDGNPLGTNGCLGVRENAARLHACESQIAGLLQRVGIFKISVRY